MVMIRDSVVDIVTRLRNGRLSYRGSIQGRGKRFYSSSNCPCRIWGPPKATRKVGYFSRVNQWGYQSQGLCGLRAGSAASRLLSCGFESHGGGAWSFVIVERYQEKSARRADHLSRGVLPTVLCRCV